MTRLGRVPPPPQASTAVGVRGRPRTAEGGWFGAAGLARASAFAESSSVERAGRPAGLGQEDVTRSMPAGSGTTASLSGNGPRHGTPPVARRSPGRRGPPCRGQAAAPSAGAARPLAAFGLPDPEWGRVAAAAVIAAPGAVLRVDDLAAARARVAGYGAPPQVRRRPAPDGHSHLTRSARKTETGSRIPRRSRGP